MAKIKKLKESKSGRNITFEISRAELVRQIEKKIHTNLHIRIINGIKTPCSNPNKTIKDNIF